MPPKKTRGRAPSSSKGQVLALVSELKKENANLHRKVVKLEVELISARNRIAALEKAGATTPLSPNEASARIAQLERELGIAKP